MNNTMSNFRNNDLAQIMKLEDQLTSIETLISEAEFYQDTATVTHYQKVYKNLSRKLSTLKKYHKESLESDYELVYSC